MEMGETVGNFSWVTQCNKKNSDYILEELSIYLIFSRLAFPSSFVHFKRK